MTSNSQLRDRVNFDLFRLEKPGTKIFAVLESVVYRIVAHLTTSNSRRMLEFCALIIRLSQPVYVVKVEIKE